MRYRDNSNKAFVLIDVDGFTNLDLADATSLVKANQEYNPSVVWADGACKFTGDIATAERSGVAMARDEVACTVSLFAVRQAGALCGPGTFILASVFRDVPPLETQTLIEAVEAAVRSVGDKPDRRLVLITSRSKLESRHRGAFERWLRLNPGLPSFEDESRSKAGTGSADFTKAMASAAPPDFQQPWDWADNPTYLDKIDTLSEADVQQIIRNQLHEPALLRLRKAMADTEKLFCNRKHAIEMMVACGLAGANIVFLGPPGTAKSELVRVFAQTLGVRPASLPIKEEAAVAKNPRQSGLNGQGGRRLFEYLLTRYTTPEELFGSADVDLLLTEGVHGRRTEGMLPQAEIGFLDEIFKANTAILNALLSLTNEKLFYNMGQAFSVKQLAFVVGASNETPADEELGALYDRFPIRVPCLPVSVDELDDVIQKAHQKRVPPRSACLNDMRLLSKVALAHPAYGGLANAFPSGQGDEKDFKTQFFKMLTAYRKEFQISDRTPRRLLMICRALGVLDGATVLGLKQLRTWGYVAPRVSAALDLQQLVRRRLEALDMACTDLFDKYAI